MIMSTGRSRRFGHSTKALFFLFVRGMEKLNFFGFSMVKLEKTFLPSTEPKPPKSNVIFVTYFWRLWNRVTPNFRAA